VTGEPSPITTGLLGRCPACGRGRLFAGFLEVVPSCRCCGTALGGQDSGDGPVAFIIMIAGGLVVGAALVVEVKHAWPLWLHMAVWLPLAVVLCLGLLRPLKGLLIALQYRHRRTDFHADG
jgi:uncharacterized protein (DUF983 family)